MREALFAVALAVACSSSAEDERAPSTAASGGAGGSEGKLGAAGAPATGGTATEAGGAAGMGTIGSGGTGGAAQTGGAGGTGGSSGALGSGGSPAAGSGGAPIDAAGGVGGAGGTGGSDVDAGPKPCPGGCSASVNFPWELPATEPNDQGYVKVIARCPAGSTLDETPEPSCFDCSLATATHALNGDYICTARPGDPVGTCIIKFRCDAENWCTPRNAPCE